MDDPVAANKTNHSLWCTFFSSSHSLVISLMCVLVSSEMKLACSSTSSSCLCVSLAKLDRALGANRKEWHRCHLWNDSHRTTIQQNRGVSSTIWQITLDEVDSSGTSNFFRRHEIQFCDRHSVQFDWLQCLVRIGQCWTGMVVCVLFPKMIVFFLFVCVLRSSRWMATDPNHFGLEQSE